MGTVYVFTCIIVYIIMWHASFSYQVLFTEKHTSLSYLLHFRDEVRGMFYHAYDGYMKHAYPYDELRPLSCDGHDTWGRWVYLRI